jgi:hypothetical protein
MNTATAINMKMSDGYTRIGDVNVKIEVRKFRGEAVFQYRVFADYIHADGCKVHRRMTAYSVEELSTIVENF